MLDYTIKSLGGFACPARFNGASCSNTSKDVPCIAADMVKRGCVITSEYHRPCDDTYVVMCQTRHGIAVSYAIPAWSVYCATLSDDNVIESIAVGTGLVSVCTDGAAFVALTKAGKKVGLYPALVRIAEAFTAHGITATAGGCCPNWGWIKVPVNLGSAGEFYVNM